jgi:hypothetical protein
VAVQEDVIDARCMVSSGRRGMADVLCSEGNPDIDTSRPAMFDICAARYARHLKAMLAAEEMV